MSQVFDHGSWWEGLKASLSLVKGKVICAPGWKGRLFIANLNRVPCIDLDHLSCPMETIFRL